MIVDDEPIIREGLRVVIDWPEHGFEICGEAGNGREALESIKELAPDLMIADVKMPVIDGLKLAELVRQAKPNTQFLVIMDILEFAYAQRAIDPGAWLPLKPIDKLELASRVERARQVLQRLYKHTDGSSYTRHLLKDAEQELVKQLCMAVEFEIMPDCMLNSPGR